MLPQVGDLFDDRGAWSPSAIPAGQAEARYRAQIDELDQPARLQDWASGNNGAHHSTKTLGFSWIELATDLGQGLDAAKKRGRK